MKTQTKELEKRPRRHSITAKLTAGQIARIAAVLLSVDILICLIFAVMFIKCAEDRVTEIWNARDQIPYGGIPAAGFETALAETGGTVVIPDWFPFLPSDMTRGSRDIVFYHYYDRNPILNQTEHFEYRAYIPDGEYIFAISLDMGVYLYYFRLSMCMALIFEAFILIGNIGKSRRKIRRALHPLIELTQTAQNINSGPFMRPDERIHVEGAIDALNAINANRLDTRISIEDERQELRGLAGAINAMLDRIDAAYKSQLRFVSDASHELRTPISVIQGYANLLNRWGKNDPKALQESIDAIKSEADSMKELIEQLLFLARGDNDSVTLNPEIIDCTGLLGEVIRETSMIDPEHEITGNIESGMKLYGDAQLIKQAVRIFVDNSIKYTPGNEKIIITGACEGGYIKISITDNGIGISGEDLPNVFDRFFRSDESRARKTGGTGLGLSIAKWIVDKHGGHINILSRLGLGTRAELFFPAGTGF